MSDVRIHGIAGSALAFLSSHIIFRYCRAINRRAAVISDGWHSAPCSARIPAVSEMPGANSRRGPRRPAYPRNVLPKQPCESAAAFSVARYASITAAQVSRQASAVPDTDEPDEMPADEEFSESADEPDEGYGRGTHRIRRRSGRRNTLRKA